MYTKPMWKGISRFATAIFALALAVACAPVSRAEDKPSETAPAQPAAAMSAVAQPATASQPSTDTQQRLQDLEKEVTALEQAIAALKASSTPVMTTAAYHPDASGAVANAPAARPDGDKISLAGLLGPTTVSGFVDGYYGYNFNHPGNRATSLTPFTQNTNQFSLNAAEFIVDKAPDATSAESRAGYHASVIYGQAAMAVNGSLFTGINNNGNDGTDFSNIALKEAYFSYLAPVGKGLTVTFGKFVTPMGAEVIESKDNWNYTRGDLFYWAIPYFHFGAKAAYSFNSKVTATLYFVNGWNNSQDNNTKKTYGGSLAYTPNMKWSFIENYLAGPEQNSRPDLRPNPDSFWRQESDTVITYSPTMKWSFMLNGDYARGDKFIISCSDAKPQGFTVTPCSTSPVVSWWGAAGYAKYTWNSKNYFATRYEYFGDPDGFAFFGGGTGHNHLTEVTGTFSHNFTSALQTRFEYRYDFGSIPVFGYGPTQANSFRKTDNTAYVGLIYTFSSANAK